MSEVMRENNIRKPVSIPKRVFHISDDDGNHKDFTVKQIDKSVIYTAGDIEVMLDTMQYVIQEAMKNGEDIRLRGFGTFTKRYRKESVVKNVLNGEEVHLPGHYYPVFIPGNDLRRSLQVYEQSLADQETNQPLPIFHQDGV